MLGLPLDVFDQPGFIVVRNRKGCVTVLPMSESREGTLLADPFRGCDLDVLDQFRQRHGGVKSCKDVHMVPCAAHPIEVALTVLNDPLDVSVQVFPSMDRDCLLAILG